MTVALGGSTPIVLGWLGMLGGGKSSSSSPSSGDEGVGTPVGSSRAARPQLMLYWGGPMVMSGGA